MIAIHGLLDLIFGRQIENIRFTERLNRSKHGFQSMRASLGTDIGFDMFQGSIRWSNKIVDQKSQYWIRCKVIHRLCTMRIEIQEYS
tara:strand:+ start:414602 stop:414862 length:261 start_codon:yes stop_codon:yes gene_type:complete